MIARTALPLLRASLALVSLVLLASSCSGGKQEPTKPGATTDSGGAKAGTESKDAHAHEGEASCTTIDIGEHQYLGDLDFDPATGTATLVVQDHASGKPFPHAKAEALLNVVLDSGTAQIKFPAAPGEGDPEGKTSRYQVSDPKLKGLKELKGRLNLTIDGKTFLCDLKAAH